MKLSVVIVSYNTKDILKQCLSALFDSRTDFQFEVSVVDNGSKDGSTGMVMRDFPRVNLIANRDNLGFAKANNQAIKKSNADYVLLLNSDVIVEPSTLQDCIDFADQQNDFGILGCKVVLPNGKLDPACKRSFPTPAVAFYKFSGLQKLFPKSHIFGQYNLTYLNENENHEVDCVMGAFLLIDKSVIDEIGLLDEDFWMYGEDIDWCYRVKKNGRSIYYFSDAKVTHYKGSSSRKISQKALYEFHRAMIIFYQKHFANEYSYITGRIVVFAIWMLYYFKAFINMFRKEKIVSKQK